MRLDNTPCFLVTCRICIMILFASLPLSKQDGIQGSATYLHQFPGGAYYFSYDTGLAPWQSFREEQREMGVKTVKGIFGYVDKAGILRLAIYTAGPYGYRVKLKAHYRT